jgi:hypothetical protein
LFRFLRTSVLGPCHCLYKIIHIDERDTDNSDGMLHLWRSFGF